MFCIQVVSFALSISLQGLGSSHLSQPSFRLHYRALPVRFLYQCKYQNKKKGKLKNEILYGKIIILCLRSCQGYLKKTKLFFRLDLWNNWKVWCISREKGDAIWNKSRLLSEINWFHIQLQLICIWNKFWDFHYKTQQSKQLLKRRRHWAA